MTPLFFEGARSLATARSPAEIVIDVQSGRARSPWWSHLRGAQLSLVSRLEAIEARMTELEAL